jgi:lipoate-protein ligase B
LITVGRRGSRDQLQLTGAELAERALTVRYVARGGGCLLHGPGQLAMYVITQLGWRGWSVGEFLRRFQTGLQGALLQLGVHASCLPGHFGLWGKTGLLAALGVAVKFGVTSHGAFLNLDPEPLTLRRIDALPAAESGKLAQEHCGLPRRPAFASLLSETSLPVKMTTVRAAVAPQLAAAFGCENYQLHTGHPLLPELPGSTERESAA